MRASTELVKYFKALAPGQAPASAPALGSARRLFTRLAQCLLFWNPLLCTFFTVLFWQGQWLVNWSSSLCISSTISMLCFFGVDLIRRMEKKIHQLMGRPAPVHQKGWYIAL